MPNFAEDGEIYFVIPRVLGALVRTFSLEDYPA